MINRRQFLKISAATGLGLALPLRLGPLGLRRAFAQLPGGTLDPLSVPKYQAPLVKPPAMAGFGGAKAPKGFGGDYYKISLRQFQQQILPSGLPQTTVWSYGPSNDQRTVARGGSFFYPAFTIEAKYNRPVRVMWQNELKDENDDFLPHLLPVDPGLHWANPIGRRDTRPNPVDDPDYWSNRYIGDDGRYIGPVPMVTHLHGAHTREESDGYPEAWWLPAGNWKVNYSTGRFFDYYAQKYGLGRGQGWGNGVATYTYPNDQRATTLWYHDHTLGMTRANVYAGPAGFYLIRGGPDDQVLDTNEQPAVLPGPAPTVGSDPFGTYYEIPIVIQGRSFNDDGSLFYPDNRAFFEGLNPDQLQIPFIYDQLGINSDANGWGYGCNGELSDVLPIWNPEFFANMMVVNGQTWPFLEVEQRRYRLRFLNGCQSRFLILKMSNDMPFYQIGADGGFLAAPAELNRLLMGPAERADVIVDFTNISVGTEIILLNLGPDEPFGGGEPGTDFDAADPGSTGQVMQFRVIPAISADTSTPPMYLSLPQIPTLVPDNTRQVSLNEEESKNIFISTDVDGNVVYDCSSTEPFGPTAALLGDLTEGGTGNPLLWMEPQTEVPDVDTTEVWEIYNFTEDAHPIHLHLVEFQVVGREQIGGGPSAAGSNGPMPWETGFKDTLIAYPGEVTRVQARFDIVGQYVWHCHILEHEDNEMMRPYHVGPVPGDSPQP
jgi:spore coat protein A